MAATVTTLSNGIRVVTDPMPDLQSIGLGVWVGVGARHETESENGISHFLEHMAFKGTQTRSARDIAETIEAVGGFLNAYTGRSQTAYHARLLKDDLALGVDLLADILRRPRFDVEEMERERTVILQEIARSDDTPDDRVYDMLQAAAYPDQAFGRSILGTRESVAALEADILRDYQDRHYTSDRLIVSASGAVDHDRLVALAQTAFGDMPLRNGAHDPSPARFVGAGVRHEAPHEQIHLALAFEGVSFSDSAYYPAWAYTEILGGGMSSRLFQDIREEKGLAYSVYATMRAYRDTGSIVLYAGTAPDAAEAVLEAMATQMEAMAQDVSETEIDRARAQIRSGLLMALESPAARAEGAASDLLQEGRIVPPEEVLDRVAAVDRTAVMALAARLLDGPPPAFSVVGPLADVPDYDRIRGRFAR